MEEGRNESTAGQGATKLRFKGKSRENTAAVTAFKGATEKMHGHVFQTYSEQKQKGQFQITLEELKVYSAENFKEDADNLKSVFKDLKRPIVPKPTKSELTAGRVITKEIETTDSSGNVVTEVVIEDLRDDDEKEVDKMIFQQRVIQWVKDTARLKATERALYEVCWGQCSKLMQTALRGEEAYQEFERDGDVCELLRAIRKISSQIQADMNPYDSCLEARRSFELYHQTDKMDLATHLQNFKHLVDCADQAGEGLFQAPGLVQYEKEQDRREGITEATDDEYERRVRERLMSISFLKKSNMRIYGDLIDDLRDQFLFKQDVYPETMQSAYNMLKGHSSANKRQTKARNGTEQGNNVIRGVQHAQQQAVPGTDGKVYPETRCHSCSDYGHIAGFCPKRAKKAVTGVQHFMEGSTDLQAGEAEIVMIDTDGKHDGTPDGSADGMPDSSADGTRNGSADGTRDGCSDGIRDGSPDGKYEDDGEDNVSDIRVSFQCFNRHVLPEDYPDTAVLIDSGSTCSVFKNKSMLKNVREHTHMLRAYTNGGHQDSIEVGDLPNFFQVWYNPKSMLNILALADVISKFRVTMDTDIASAFNVHLHDGTILNFKQVASGLFLLTDNKYFNKCLKAYSCLTLVTANKSQFSRRELEGIERARQLYKHIGMPGYSTFKYMLENNLIHNCPVTVEDVQRCIYVYGEDTGTLQGRTTRSRPRPIPAIGYLPLAPSILEQHQHVMLSADYFFVNGIPFLHTYSRGFCYRTCEPIRGKNKANAQDTIQGLTDVLNIYKARGLTVTQINCDNEFEPVREHFRPIFFNVVAADEHVGDVERSIRTVKEDVRCLLADLPYHAYPKEMVVGAVVSAIRMRNRLPSQHCVSTTLSPANLVLGERPLDYNAVTALRFGSFVHTHEASRNDMTPRTQPAIALYPSGSTGGGWYFMSLSSGRLIHRYRYTILPVDDTTIAAVKQLAATQNQPTDIHDLTFEWSPGDLILDTTDDEQDAIDSLLLLNDPMPLPDAFPAQPTLQLEYQPNPDQGAFTQETDGGAHGNTIDADQEVIDAHDPLAHTTAETAPTQTQPLPIMDTHEAVANEGPDALPNEGHGATIVENTAVPTVMIDREGQHTPIVDDETVGFDTTHNSNVEDEDTGHTQHAETEPLPIREETQPEERNRFHMSLRDRRPTDYRQLNRRGNTQLAQRGYVSGKKKKKKKHVQQQQVEVKLRDAYRRIVGIIMAHMDEASAKHKEMPVSEGIKRFGQSAVDAVFAEFAQLSDLTTFHPQDASKLSYREKKKALKLLTKVKQKRCGRIKARGCADGRKQRLYVKKEDVTSPTVLLESFIFGLLIDALEGRTVATADIAGAYLLAFMKEFVLVKLSGESVGIMCQVNPSYRKFVVMEGGREVLYMRLNKALYGCMQSAILWYETFAGKLKEMGFKLNPYDPCVANKDINGEQCTIMWYVDDMKVSHKDPAVVEQILTEIEQTYGKLTIKRGKDHTFIGMDCTIRDDQKVEITMKQYIEECIASFGEKIHGKASTPGKHDLFEPCKGELSVELEGEKAETFHHIVSKLLYVSKRARLDIDLVVSYLCTRTTKSTKGDWEKLRRLLTYLNGTIDMKRIISLDGSGTLRTWVDASHAVHEDMRGQTGGAMSGGSGLIHHKTSKQKLNTKSSTESELVGASDYLPWNIWMTSFMQGQGYEVKDNIFYQDNESAIRLEKNGKRSSSEKTRHIKIRYYFVHDIIKREKLDLRYCPTTKMIADFYTKPLQGSLFVKLRDAVMGHTDIPMEERVENHTEQEYDVSKKSTIGTSVGQPKSYADAVRATGNRCHTIVG